MKKNMPKSTIRLLSLGLGLGLMSVNWMPTASAEQSTGEAIKEKANQTGTATKKTWRKTKKEVRDKTGHSDRMKDAKDSMRNTRDEVGDKVDSTVDKVD